MKRLLLLTTSLVLFPVAASAAPCQTDADCEEREVCVLAPGECPPCTPGGECPPCDEPTAGECAPADGGGGFWSGLSCEADSDCPDLFTCDEVSVPCAMPPTCGCADCDPDGGECPECDCPEVDETPCESETVKTCVYEPATCEADADCGAGFECYAQEVCSGGGSSCGCAPCAEGETCEPCECDDEPVSDEGSCETVGSYCAPKPTPCKADADCPEGWECAALDMGCACPACACAEGEECTGCGDCTCDSEGDGLCLPGGWSEAVAVAADAGGEGGQGGGSGGGASGPTKGGLGDFLGGAAESFDQGNGGGNDNGGAGGNDDGSGDGAGGAGGTGGSGGSGSSGCAVTASAATGFAAIFLVLLAIFAVLTRRVAVRDEQ